MAGCTGATVTVDGTVRLFPRWTINWWRALTGKSNGRIASMRPSLAETNGNCRPANKTVVPASCVGSVAPVGACSLPTLRLDPNIDIIPPGAGGSRPSRLAELTIPSELTIGVFTRLSTPPVSDVVPLSAVPGDEALIETVTPGRALRVCQVAPQRPSFSDVRGR